MFQHDSSCFVTWTEHEKTGKGEGLFPTPALSGSGAMGLISAHSVNKWAPQEYEPCYRHALPALPSLNDVAAAAKMLAG